MTQHKRARVIGEGSIYRNAARNNWTAQLRINGRKVRRSAPTQRDAARLLRELQRQGEVGVVTGRETVARYLGGWVDTKRTRVRAVTLRGYEVRIRANIIPQIGAIPLASLRPQHVERMLSALGEKLSPRSVAHVRAVLHNALDDAERWGRVERNVARVVDAPRVPNVERTALMPADVRKLLAALDGDTLRPVYLLAALLGLRQEEALGLRWRDVDFDAGTVQIAQTLKLVGREVIVDEPKSPRSRRTLPLMPLVADSLREHRQHQREQRLQAGSAWHDGGLVFTSQTGGPLRGPSVTRHLQAVLAAAGLPRVTFHDLRHACASIHVALGTSPRVLMAILGHSDATLALSLYAHTDAEMMRASAAALQDFMAPQWAPQVQPTAG